MKLFRILCSSFFVCLTSFVYAQNIPADTLFSVIKRDDATKLESLLTKNNINDCYGNISLLTQAVRQNAKKCFDVLIAKGADVNKICNGYIPPIMHASKYGRLDMVKILVAKGANINYTYHGDFKPADGQTPVTYAEKYQHIDIADYLRSLKK